VPGLRPWKETAPAKNSGLVPFATKNVPLYRLTVTKLGTLSLVALLMLIVIRPRADDTDTVFDILPIDPFWSVTVRVTEYGVGLVKLWGTTGPEAVGVPSPKFHENATTFVPSELKLALPSSKTG